MPVNLRNAAGSGERRQAPRHLTELPVELENGMGITRDISTTGVFFKTSQSHVPGAPIKFFLILEHIQDSPTRLCCEGKVIRVEPCGKQLGIAVNMTSFRFEPS